LLACNSDKTDSKATTESTTSDTANKKDEAWVPIDSATMEKAWMEYATPGTQHAMLAKSNGNWNAEMTHWMGKGAPAMTTKGTCVNSMMMDGRYQKSEFKADFMGMPFNGMSVTGYDNYEKIFKSTWVDNMGTGIIIMQGPWDESSRSMTLTGTSVNPANGKECKMREVFKIVDDNTQIMEMYGPDPQTGEEFKNMEIKFTRK
jgi:hypothetical protein